MTPLISVADPELQRGAVDPIVIFMHLYTQVNIVYRMYYFPHRTYKNATPFSQTLLYCGGGKTHLS